MERNEERRDEHEKRVPIRAAVELAESRDDAFEADAVNLSRGGMSLRSQCLPDVGARLWCRFEHPPSGSVIEAEGEVVWAQLEGEASGEIGLAFTDLDPKTEMLIEQIIAQHGSPTAAGEVFDAGEQDRAIVAREAQEALDAAPPPRVEPKQQRASLPPISGARVANLSLEGISEPLSANVAELTLDYAVFEQVLPLLKLGRAISADTPELLGRRGAIAGVELRMMGHVPTLAVMVDFSDEHAAVPSYGEASFSSTDVPAMGDEGQPLAHDTEPDLEAPSEPSRSEHALPAAHRVTAAEFSSSPLVKKPQQLALDVAPMIEEPMAAALASSVGVEQRVEQSPSARGNVEAVEAAKVIARPSRLDETKVLELADESDDDVGSLDDPFAPAAPAWKPFVLAALRGLQAFAGVLKLLGARAARLLGSSGVAALPHVRMLMVRARALGRQVSIAVGPQLGAARRFAGAQLGRKRRRTTAGGNAAPRESQDSGSLVRTIGLGALVTAIAGLGVYAVLPTAEPELELHRAIEGEAGVSGEEAAQPADAPVANEPGAELAPAAAEPALPMPSAASVPAGSPFAVDVREGARPKAAPVAPAVKPLAAAVAAPQAAPIAAKPAPRSMRFGASTAPSHSQTFQLRMSKPITSITGSGDAGGFTVAVMGTLSLDRAGPISAAHRGVARAMVLNKGDHAELTIRFVDGKRPVYQVRGDGTTLYVIIEDV